MCYYFTNFLKISGCVAWQFDCLKIAFACECATDPPGNFVDPYWFQCGSEFSFLSQCGSGSKSQYNADPSKKLNFYMKTYLKVGKKSKKLRFLHEPFWKAGNQVFLSILVNYMLLKTVSALPIRPGSRTAKWIQINAYPAPQHCPLHNLPFPNIGNSASR